MEAIEKKSNSANRYLVAGVFTSVGASVCCLGPFVLLATGVNGAWMSQLMILEPYQPIFVLIVLALFAAAGRKIFYASNKANPLNDCSISSVGRHQSTAFFLSGGLAAMLLTSVYWIPVLAA